MERLKKELMRVGLELGESMIDYDIREGDRLIVHCQRTADRKFTDFLLTFY